jgi:probable phosphoglycerate mutase
VIPLALIRHGPTVWNEQKRLQGQTDVPLSPDGHATVEGWRVPREFHDYRWVSSPLSRARQTATLLGLAVRGAEPAIVEMHWGEWEGQTHNELRERYGEEFKRRAGLGLDLRPHGGESPRDVRARVQAWVGRLAQQGLPTGAVTHQGVIRAAISLATGWDMVTPPPHEMDWASLHLFAVDDDGAVTIDRLNISLAPA